MVNTTSIIAELEQLTLLKDVEIAKKDPYYFITRMCYTMNEHDKTGNPYHLIPQKEYIRDLCDLFQVEDLLAVEKSRQMMVSWWAMAIALWYTMFNPGKRTFIMSKKEKDAAALIDRIKTIYDRLPINIKQQFPADLPFTYNRIRFGKTDSVIQGLAQGADQVRQYTASLLVMDEAAFQEQAEKTFEAILPTLTGGGKLIVISTTNGKNWFYRVTKDLF